jgi:hypothetical protein
MAFQLIVHKERVLESLVTARGDRQVQKVRYVTQRHVYQSVFRQKQVGTRKWIVRHVCVQKYGALQSERRKASLRNQRSVGLHLILDNVYSRVM